MFPASTERIRGLLTDSDLVLDVGGWAKPYPRADWVLDLMPYATRGIYGERGDERERFDEATWVERDICAREPWSFDDDQFDFVICSHTLEDVRDPIWVCSELARVAKAGYVEVPSRLEEQAWGVAGEWVGWSHHHWLVDVDHDAAEVSFVLKPHVIHGTPAYYLEPPLGALLTAEERVQCLFWQGSFAASERIFFDHEEFERYLGELVRANRERLAGRMPDPPRGGRLRRALGARS